MSTGYSHIVAWRKRTKKILIDACGGKCRICAYDRHVGALEFHHIDPSQKDFTISRKIQSIEKILIEVQKCILVCANCHREIHGGLHDAINITPIFITPIPKTTPLSPCLKCGILKNTGFKFCSQVCSQKFRERVRWDEIDLKELLKINNFNMSAVGRILGITSNAVKKRAIKCGLIN